MDNNIVLNIFLTIMKICLHIFLGGINVIYNYITLERPFTGQGCGWVEHKIKVDKVQKQVNSWAGGDRKRKMCTARPVWKSVSVSKTNKSGYYQIDLGNLNDVVEINEEEMTVTVEPGMCIGRLTRILVKKGWTLPVVPEIDYLTVGGLIAGAGLESSSHNYGLFCQCVVETEILMPNGEVLTCSREQNFDLANAIPHSYGTIGFITALKFKMIRAKKYVELDYRFTNTIEDALKLINEGSSRHEFIEGIAYSKEKFLIMFGNMVDTVDPTKGRENPINRWYKKFFYLQVEEIVEKLIEKRNNNQIIEYVPLLQYYHRHSRGMFWLERYANPFFYNSQIFMWLFGCTFPFHIDILGLISRPIYDVLYQSFMIQDFVVPEEKTAKLFNEADKMLNIYPVWMCPARTSETGGCFNIPEKYLNCLYIDLGFYGYPKKNKGDKLNRKPLLRHFEKFCLKNNGYQGLYADCYMSKEEFETMFDFKSFYYKVRKERNCDEAFPTVYDKISAKARNLESDDDMNHKQC